jgi:hypothetical protein
MSDKRRDTTALRKILKAVRAGQIIPYRNLRNEPYVYCDHEKYTVAEGNPTGRMSR